MIKIFLILSWGTLMGVSACFQPVSDISEICRIPENAPQIGKMSFLECGPKTAQCPVQETKFCAKPYQRELGFWYRCAPSDLPFACEEIVCDPTQEKDIPEFDPDHIFKAIKFSALVYESDSVIRQMIAQADNANINIRTFTVPLTSTSYAIYEDADFYHIGIQGSDSTCELSLDIGAGFETDPSLYHMKFHKGYFSVAEEIYAKLPPLMTHKNKPVFITGHSLGGAVSSILAMKLVQQGYKVDSVITFGQPQVTNSEGVALFNQYFSKRFHMLRVINGNDIFPYILWVLDNSFAHFGTEMRIEQSKTGPAFVLLDTPDGIRWTGQTDLSKIDDHDIEAYRDSLLKIFKDCSST